MPDQEDASVPRLPHPDHKITITDWVGGFSWSCSCGGGGRGPSQFRHERDDEAENHRVQAYTAPSVPGGDAT